MEEEGSTSPSPPPTPPEFLHNNTRLKYDKKLYCRDKTLSNGKTYWVCIHTDCEGRDQLGKDKQLTGGGVREHSCTMDELDCQIEQFIQDIKDAALSLPTTPSSEVVAFVKAKYNPLVQWFFDEKLLRRSIRGWRKRAGIIQPKPVEPEPQPAPVDPEPVSFAVPVPVQPSGLGRKRRRTEEARETPTNTGENKKTKARKIINVNSDPEDDNDDDATLPLKH